MRDAGSYRSESRDTPGRRQPSFRMSAEQMLVLLTFVTIGVLFAATLVAYAVTRVQAERWRPPGTPGLPVGLGVSSLLAVAVSLAMHRAVSAVRDNRELTMRRALWAAVASAVGFVAAQTVNWSTMFRTHEAAQAGPSLFAFTFYLMTALHAAHVVGGFVPLGVVLHRANAREYSSSRHQGLRFCAWYWHYLAAIWFVLLATMLIAQ